MVVTAHGEKLLPGSVGVASAKQFSAVADTELNFSETVALTTNALRWAPLDWELYLERAMAEVELKQTKNAVDDSGGRDFWSRSLMKFRWPKEMPGCRTTQFWP